MELNITFGWHLDGPSYPETSAIGRLAVGPIGLLSQLCLRLGLTSRFPAQAVRIAEYMSLLKAADDGARFYSRSFETDSWGTAKALLFFRDELVGNGCSLKSLPIDGNSPERLRTFAEIEKTAGRRLVCISDMLIAVIERLEKIQEIGIDSITLIDDENLLPPIWRKLFASLRSKNIAVSQWEGTPSSSRHEETDVEKLVRFLSKEERSALSGDGTFCVLESDDEVQAADCVASLLSVMALESEQTVLIRGNSTSFLDHYLRKRNLPVLGGAGKSPLRGYMQILPLALELLFSPVDPARLIEFLMLPRGPVSPSVARLFIDALKNQPGIGGGAWQNAWTNTMSSYLKRLTEEAQRTNSEPPSQEDLQKSISDYQLHLKSWLEPERFYEKSEASADAVVSLCDRVRKHAHMRINTLAQELNSDQLQVFLRTATAAETFASSVKASQSEKFSRSQLMRMLESSMSEGYSPCNPHASIWTPVDHPGQIFGPVDNVIWWGFVETERLGFTNPWSTEEIAFLRSKGVNLDTPQDAVVREAKSWCRPLFAPTRRLLLVKPRTLAGRTVSAHPFYHEISAAIESTPHEDRHLFIKQAHQIYSHPECHFLGKKISTTKITPLDMPAPRPVWNIGANALEPRVESATSLERLMACPMSWLFRYRANLKFGDLLSVASGELLAGNLAHAVFAAVFSTNDDALFSSAQQAAAHAFDELCPKIALPLLLPGKSLERQRLKKAICDAAESLASMVRQAGFAKVICESRKDATLSDIPLTGRPDLVLVHPDNFDYAIDLKWTRRTSYRRREISDGRAIQLAVYSELLKQESGLPTSAGYYLISQRQLLSVSKEPFPEHTYVDGPPLEQTFRILTDNFKNHMRYLNEGTVYATGLSSNASPLFEDDDIGLELLSDDDPEVVPSRIPGITMVLEPPCRICEFGRLCGKKEFNR